MAFAHYFLAVPVEPSKLLKTYLPTSSSSSPPLFSLAFASSSLRSKARKPSIFSKFRRIGHKVSVSFISSIAGGLMFIVCKLLSAKAKQKESEVSIAEDAFNFKHLLLPITDRNPYLSEGTIQAVATTAALAKKYGADITVVVIDGKQKESLPEHEAQLTSIRWHLSEGGFQEFKLLERLGEGNKPTAIIGEVADDLNLDLVVISMEAIHSKHVDANLLAEFIPCPVILLPL
ncbi:hypothetical protein FH972_007018 [Carpinus fangiana]|uniref:UspA domain-containing protein n=1 Tax=Carpinus fangiana TaxID=176857 RepID=A0A5N6QVW2_9ROSI|nr:hypothetical protein FH972_007018 [Carpinus fangiana]